MIYSYNIIIIIFLIFNHLKSVLGGGTIIVVNQDGNKSCSNGCIALFSLLGIGIAVAISSCVYWYSKRYGIKKKYNSSSNVMITNDLNDLNDLEQPSLPTYDSQPPAYSELSNPPPVPPTLIHSESFDDAEEFFRNNETIDSLPSNDVIQELLNQDDYSYWKFTPEKILMQLEIVIVRNNGRELILNNSKKKGLKYNEIMIQSNLPFFNPKKIFNNEKIELEEVKEKNNDNLFEDLHYFEITIAEKSDDVTKIAIGLTTNPYPYYRLPGYNKYSIGYHSENGNKYQDSQFNLQEYGPKWSEIGNTVGCGYRSSSGEVFFTKDGEYLGVAHSYGDDDHVWYPTIGAEGTCKIEVNFGDSHNMFKYKPARSYGPGAQGGWLYKHLDPSKKWAGD
ncbi:SPRY domain-containing protein [Rhizophagus diaphanus]|nr:SPRY domain-containing protein [Rhizophagus diaphanus] [Rhizophagus sp. MUCL 43196]